MNNPQPTPAKLLATPVQYLKGVGPERAELLHRLELHTAADVLFFFPRDYQDFTDEREIGRLEEGKLQTVRGVVDEIDMRTSQSGRAVLGVLIRNGTEYLRALWFNQPFMREKFDYGQRVMLSGKPKYEGLIWQMHHPRVETLAEDEEAPAGKILPVYPLTEGLQQWHMRKIVRWRSTITRNCSTRSFPPNISKPTSSGRSGKPCRRSIFPTDRESLEHARRRFVYQELFVLQLALAVKRRQQHDQRRSPALEATALIDARIRRLFPFELTEGQRQAVAEIARDMAGPLPMNRLLQGEVGSGKTAGRRVCHAPGRGPRISGRADGPHRSPCPATLAQLGQTAFRKPGAPRAVDRRTARGPTQLRFCSRLPPARWTSSSARRPSSRTTCRSPSSGWW